MKRLIIMCICSIALAAALFAQTPTASPTPSTTAAASATASASPSDLAERIQEKLEKKLRGHHGIIIDRGDHDVDVDRRGMRTEGGGEIAENLAIPIVAIVFLTVFGAPVLLAIVVGIWALAAQRARHRTIRMMVEKGQPVPVELLAQHTGSVRQRSDVRRGVVWAMIGLGFMIWLGAVNDWHGGAWSFGLIPFLIGLGYLIVWKLDTKKNNPPPPAS